jgi:lipopolysaccharide/colanic/teichoic acid biosynthesis glycosyltransferase
MDRQDRSPDVQRAAQRLGLRRARAGLAVKRGLDVLLSLLMLVVLAPVTLLVCVLLAGAGGGWLEHRVRLGRDGRPVRLARFRELPGGFGRALERVGARDVPLLTEVLAGRLSFVGPRPLAPGTAAGFTGPRRLMAPGLTGPAQRWATDDQSASELDDAYVVRWTLLQDLRLLLCLRCSPHGVEQQAVGKRLDG